MTDPCQRCHDAPTTDASPVYTVPSGRTYRVCESCHAIIARELDALNASARRS